MIANAPFTYFLIVAITFVIVLECGPPAEVEHASITLLNGTRQFKSVVQYQCLPGYVMVGRSKLMCDVDERWNGPPPRCEPVYCDEPPQIRHGGFSLSTNSTRYVYMQNAYNAMKSLANPGISTLSFQVQHNCCLLLHVCPLSFGREPKARMPS